GVLAATLADTWQVAVEMVARVGGDPGFPGLIGPRVAPATAKPRRLAVLETAGWRVVSGEAKQALQDAVAKLANAGVKIVTRHSNAQVAAVEEGIADAQTLSLGLNAWESRWPLNTYKERDASKLSRSALDRLAQAEAMTIDDYRRLLAERVRIRGLYAALASQCDGCVTLPATGAAPVGLNSTGNPAFAVPFSLLGVPALSLPLLREQSLPLGLQVTGFANEDAATFGVAAWLMQTLGDVND
ncbi:MAG TPA: amidase family protein, partial [Pseudolabrys sp.]